MRNIAALGYATQSSYSNWSYNDSESRNVLIGYAPNQYAFHTKYEDNPYLLIDLKKIYAINGIRISPRYDMPDRYCPFLDILVSSDGMNYNSLKSINHPFADGYSQVILELIDYPHVRYIVLKSRKCMFSLTQVEIFIDDKVCKFRNCNIRKNKYQTQSILNSIDNETYEAGEINKVLNNVLPRDNVLELGSNIGVMACCVCKHKAVNNYYAFEANPLLIPEIKMNLDLNGIGNVEVFNNVMVRDDFKGKYLDFYIAKSILASSLLEINNPESVEKIKIKKINEFLSDKNITFLISDIEGGEYELFFDGINLKNVRCMVIETHRTERDRFQRFLGIIKGQGFKWDSNPDESRSNVIFFYR